MGQNKLQVSHEQFVMLAVKIKSSSYLNPLSIPFHALLNPEWSNSNQEVIVMQHKDSTSCSQMKSACHITAS